MDKILDRLKNLENEQSRYSYADAVTNAFLTAQIKELREARNLTQEQLATLVGTKQSGISRWLNTGFATCKVETLRKFAKAYGLRLRITLESFGSLPEDVGGFVKERLTPPKFADDPAFREPSRKEQESALVAKQGIAEGPKDYKPAGGLQALAGLGPIPEHLSWLGNSCEVAGEIAARRPPAWHAKLYDQQAITFAELTGLNSPITAQPSIEGCVKCHPDLGTVAPERQVPKIEISPTTDLGGLGEKVVPIDIRRKRVA